jgi:ribosomal protein L40E
MTTPRFCVSCGAELEPEARFCRSCGTAVAAAAEPVATVCAYCGADLQPGRRFCTRCGTAVGSDKPPAADPLTGLTRSPLALVAAGVVVVAVIAVLVLVLAGGGGDEEASGQEPVSAEVTNQLSLAVASLPDAEGDTDLEQMRSLLGPPDAFTLALEVADDGQQSRREEWFYYDLLSVYEFVDGSLVSNLPLDEGGLMVAPKQYDPADFTLGVTWDEVPATLDDPDAFESYPLEDEYEIDATYYVGAQLLLVFDEEGLLVYVETQPLEAGVEE